LLAEAKEPEAVTVAASDGLGDGAERFENLPVVREAALQHLDLQRLALVFSRQDRAGRRQAFVDGRWLGCDRRLDRHRLGGPARHRRGLGRGWGAGPGAATPPWPVAAGPLPPLPRLPRPTVS